MFDHRPLTADDGLRCRLWSTVRRLAFSILSLLLVLLSGCQAETSPTPAPSVTLALLGDVMLGRGVHLSAQTFATLEPSLKSADLTLANLESPLTNVPVQTQSPYALCASPGNVSYLAEAGFDLLSLSNNHRLDCGKEGLAETQSTLTKAELGFIGPGPEPVYRDINGIRLAFLAFDLTAGFRIETAKEAIRSAHGSGAVVIVSIHWGTEYQSGASPEQKQIAAQLAEAGAALIWGHHPHVLQPAEWINSGKTLALYSLGNALFDQAGLADTRQSALALVTLEASGVKTMRVIPFVINVPDSRIEEADPASAETILGFFKRAVEKTDH